MSKKPYIKLSKSNRPTLPAENLPTFPYPFPTLTTYSPPPINCHPNSIIQKTWEALALCLPPYKEPDLLSLDILSSITYKLQSASNNTKSLEIKSQEFLIKQEMHEAKKAEHLASLQSEQKNAQGLTPEDLRLIEQQLKLL